MAYSNDTFEAIARQEFKFLENDYHFHIYEIIKNNYGCFVMYKAPTVAVRVNFDIYDGGVYVYIYRLKDDKIPKYPVFFDSKEEFLIFDFNNLMILRAKRIIEQDWKRVYEDPEYTRRIVKQFADSLKQYAADVLKGDFSVLPEIHKIVIRRAKELENEM